MDHFPLLSFTYHFTQEYRTFTIYINIRRFLTLSGETQYILAKALF